MCFLILVYPFYLSPTLLSALFRAGTKRFQKGYLAYAGAGKNSRGTQLIMAFQDNLYLGGGSPWEVPFAQVYGASSFETLGEYALYRSLYTAQAQCFRVATRS